MFMFLTVLCFACSKEESNMMDKDNEAKSINDKKDNTSSSQPKSVNGEKITAAYNTQTLTEILCDDPVPCIRCIRCFDFCDCMTEVIIYGLSEDQQDFLDDLRNAVDADLQCDFFSDEENLAMFSSLYSNAVQDEILEDLENCETKLVLIDSEEDGEAILEVGIVYYDGDSHPGYETF